MLLPDAHIHLDATGLPQVRESLCVTCTPAEFDRAAKRCDAVALGLHPWQITEDNANKLLSEFLAKLPQTHLIGEVGLDFYKQYAQFDSVQSYIFTSICEKLAEGSYIVSIHSRGAGTAVLDTLERTGAADSCTCILHGFNGSSPELSCALELGCLFSLGPRQLATRRGREYARQLPAERILLETDADGSMPFGLEDWERELEGALSTLNEIRGASMRLQIEENWKRVFGPAPNTGERRCVTPAF